MSRKEFLKSEIQKKEKEEDLLIKHESWGAAEGVNKRKCHLIEQYETELTQEEREQQWHKNALAGLQSLSKGEKHYYIF